MDSGAVPARLGMEGTAVTESDEPAAEAQIGAVIADKLEDDDGLHPRDRKSVV